MRTRDWLSPWLCSIFLLACGDDPAAISGMTGSGGQTGASGQPAPGRAGMSATLPPSAGTTARAGTGGPAAGGAGAGVAGAMAAGRGAAGAAGSAGSTAGAGGSAGSAGGAGSAAGAGGSAGSAAGAGGSAGSAGSDGTKPSGPDPTMESASRAGTLKVATIPWTEFRNGPEFAGGTIWYPSDGVPPYPFAAVVPGFASYESSISSWGRFLASHGIVTITIDTNTTGDIPLIRAGALMDALKSVSAENMRSGSPLMGKLDESRQALMGWSMGGGGTLIAANSTPSIKAAISLCGWNPGGSYPMMSVPSLMFASLGDPLAGGQSQGFYRSIPEKTPKMLIEAGVADHWLANNPANLSGMIGRYGLSWLKVYLQNDERYRQFLLQMPPGTTDYASNVK